jgi:RES domain-containing protein
MEVYRLARQKYAHELSGKGAAIKGARWNSPGTELIYTAGNRSLAMAEVAVHLSLGTLPDDYFMLTIYVPDNLSMDTILLKDLSENWNQHPPVSRTQNYGDEFIAQGEFCLLKVPSAVTKGDFNYLINPYHREFSRIQVVEREHFPFDLRIFNV